MAKSISNDVFLNKIKNKGIKHIPLEKYRNGRTKILWRCAHNSNHIFECSPDAMLRRKDGCPYCTHQRVMVGETDMWTTHPEIARLLYNHNDGYKYFITSNKKVDWICPNCHSVIKDKLISNVAKQGLHCGACSDSMSFAEKFIFELLIQTGYKFNHNHATSWSQNKRYDFYIEELSLIIETHGLQHYEQSFRFNKSSNRYRSLENEIENDKFKKDLAIQNGVKHYIELDCRKSELDYIKNSISNSSLPHLINLTQINWGKCLKRTMTSNVVACANLWNDGIKSTKIIADKLGLHISTVISYLKKATEIQLCDYQKNYEKNRNRYNKKVLCVETGKIYNYIKDVQEDGYCAAHISGCCNKKYDVAYGLHWRFI